MRRKLALSLVTVCTLIAGVPAASAAPGEITKYPIPILTTPYSVANGPDGKIWIVDSGNHNGGTFIGRMTTSGQISVSDLIQLPTSDLALRATLGADGNMWVLQGGHLNKVPISATQTSDITSYPLPGAGTGGFGSLVSGPDNRLWYGLNHDIGTATTGGVTGSYSPVASSTIPGVISGPGGKIWFGKDDGIARMSTGGVSGVGDVFPLPSGHSGVFDLAPGPDGNVWFTLTNPAEIGKITPSGGMSFYTVPTANSLPFGITAGPDDHMWFVERNGDKVGSIPLSATSGSDIREYPVGTSNAGLEYIIAGPDNRMWFNVFNENKIGAITTGAAAPSPTPPAPTPGGGGTATTPDVPMLPALPPTPAAVGCTPNKLILTDVYPSGGKTRLLGVAPAAAVGKKVTIISTWNGKTVATAKVAADASFSTSAALPPAALRGGDRARYVAKLASSKSQALKFARRAYTTSITASGRSIVFKGTITKPFAKPVASVMVRASTSCTTVAKGAVVGTTTPSASGAFTVTGAVPAALASAKVLYLRAETRVQKTKANRKTFPTFTLIRGIKVG